VRRYKNWLAKGLILSLLLSSRLFAQPSDTISLVLNGEKYSLQTQPIVKSGTSLVGMRELFEILGAKVEWDAKEQKISATKGINYIELKVGSKIAYKNGEKLELPLAPEVKDGVTYMPLRWVGEALDTEIQWLEEENSIYITTQKEESKIDNSYEKDIYIPSMSIEPIKYGNAKELSLEEVKKRAVGGNMSLRLQEVMVDQAKLSADLASRTPMVSDGFGGYVAVEDEGINSLIRRSTANLGADAAKKQQELLKESVAFLAENTYNEIVDLEMQLAITQASVEISKENLDIIRKKEELGLESKHNLSIAEKEQQQLENQLETLSLTLDSKYIELNSIIGEVPNSRYILEREREYQPLEDIKLRSHISKMISEDFYVWYSKKNKELKDLERSAHGTSWVPGDSYKLKDDEYKKAELSEEATKKNLEKSLESRYNQILQLEKQIEAQKLNIEKARESYEILVQQYKLGMIIPLQLKQAELGIYNAELELQRLISQHNQLKQAFYKPSLMPDYAN